MINNMLYVQFNLIIKIKKINNNNKRPGHLLNNMKRKTCNVI